MSIDGEGRLVVDEVTVRHADTEIRILRTSHGHLGLRVIFVVTAAG
jgi:hypothetical protein